MEIHIKHIFSKIIGYFASIFFSYLTILFFISFSPGDEYWPIVVMAAFAIFGLLLPEIMGEVFFTEETIQYRSRVFGVMEMKWEDVIRIELDNVARMGFFSRQGRLIVGVPLPLSRKGRLLDEMIVAKSETLDFLIVVNPILQYKFSKGVRVKHK